MTTPKARRAFWVDVAGWFVLLLVCSAIVFFAGGAS